MNNDELKKKIAQIIADYFCPQGNEHKKLWGDDRLCYSKMNFAECEWVTECTDALISAGIGDLKEHRIFAGKDGSIKQLYSGEEVEKIVKEREEYKHRAEVAERKGMTDEKVYSVDEVNHLISEMDKVIAKLKTENVALRERLEKAVELPCKLYDKVWDKNRSEFEILEIRVTGTNFYIYCGNKTTGETVYFDGEDIGDEWFTTEEACDLHRRAFGLDKPKNESDEARLAELKGEER